MTILALAAAESIGVCFSENAEMERIAGHSLLPLEIET